MLNFSKMQALGNDFVVVNNLIQKINISELPIKQLAHRQLGVGFDQLLVIENSQKADFSCRIFNADGSEVEQCGNGLRCVVKYINDEGLSKKNNVTIETLAGVFTTEIFSNNQIQISLGQPSFETKKMHDFEIDSQKISATVLSLGNPHFITRVNSLKNYPLENLGKIISTLPIFPESTNVGFMEIVNASHILLRTYERGVGLTQACGSNACAAVIAGILNHELEEKVTVELPLGNLSVEWPNKKGPVFLTGPAEKVFDGEVCLQGIRQS